MKLKKIKFLACAILLFTGLSGCETASGQATIDRLKGTSIMLSQNAQHLVTSKTVIPANTSSAFKVAWSPDAKQFAVSGSALQVTVYEAATHQIVRVLHFKKSGALIDNVAYSPDGKYLAAGNGIITIWDTKTWQPVRDIEGPYAQGVFSSQGVDTIAFSANSKMIAAHYAMITDAGGQRLDTVAEHDKYHGTKKHYAIWAFDIETGQKIFSVLTDGDKEVGRRLSGNLLYTPDGKYLVSARTEFATNPKIKITGERFQYITFVDFRDVKTGQIVKSITPVHVMHTTALALSRDGRFLATGTKTLAKESELNPLTQKWDYINNQDPIRLWDINNGQLVREFGPLRGAVRALSFSSDGKYLASCQTDIKERETLWLWDIASGQVIERISTPNSGSEFFDCALSPDDRHIVMPVANQIYLIGIRP